MNCANCKHAVWQRTASGRLHPSGDGKCMFTWEPQPLPKSYNFDQRYICPIQYGKSVNRRSPYGDCPTWGALANRAETGAD